MVGPEVVWIDPRVAARLPEPNEENSGLVQYVRADVVARLEREAGGPGEFLIQIIHHPTNPGAHNMMAALTNYGRIYFCEVVTGKWSAEMPGPDFNKQ